MDIKNVAKEVTTNPMEQIKSENSQAEASNTGAEKETGYVKKEADYTSVNRDGDTLEISGKTTVKVGEDGIVIKPETSSKESTVKYTDLSLSKMPDTRLRALLSSGQISKAQYDKATHRNG